MNLTVDIGNSFTHIGLFSNKLILTFKYPTHSKPNIDLLKTKFYSEIIESAGISSVVPTMITFWQKRAIKWWKIKPLIVNNRSKLPVRLKVKNSNTLGSDRICNAVYGYEYFNRRENVIIADLGTANTYDAVLKNGDFIGGIIAPGIDTSALALNMNTAKLPLLNIKDYKFNKSLIGRDTKQAIQSGLMNYALFATEGIVKAIEKELKRKFKVIITGGPAKIIHNRLSIKSIYVENTVLEGINAILNYQNH
jgi:type III pantothenate kinase